MDWLQVAKDRISEIEGTHERAWVNCKMQMLMAVGASLVDIAESLRVLARTGAERSDREAAERLRGVTDFYVEGGVYDVKAGHMAADELLCTVLLSHGYVELVDEFRSIRKWYE